MSYNYHRQFDHHRMSNSYARVGRSAQYLLDRQQLSRPPHQMESVQTCRPTYWDPPSNRPLLDFQPYDPPQPPHLRVTPSRLGMPQQSTYKQPPHRTGMERYEQLIDLLDAATSRLESRWEEIDRRVTKLQSSQAAYGQQLYADIDSEPPRRRPTFWDLPSQTSGRRVGEIHAPPLPEPPPRFPPGVYTGRQRDCQQPQNRSQHLTFPSSYTPTRPQLVFDQKPPPQLVLDQQPPPSHRCSTSPPPAAAQPPPLRSDCPLKQPSTTSTIEPPPYAAPSPCQALLPLSGKAPLWASTRQPQAGVSSSRKKEWETDLHDGEERREEKLIVLNSVWNQRDKEKENDSTAKREEEVNNTFLKLLEKENKAEALRSSLETKENDFSVLTAKPSKREGMKIQGLVDEHKAGFEMKKQDCQVELEEKRRLFEDELKLKTEELGKKGNAHTGSQALACVYVDLNVSDVTSMNPRLPSLDGDARLIPPGKDAPCLSILGGVDKIFVLAWNFADHIGYRLMISDGGDEGGRLAVRCAFDPGGDALRELLLLTPVVASWLPP